MTARRSGSKSAKHLGEFEQLVLLALLRQGEHSYASPARRELDRRAGRAVSRGALYRTFDRLQSKGYLEWELEPGSETAERGGMPLRRFRVTGPGLAALRQSRTALLEMWDGLESILGEP